MNRALRLFIICQFGFEFRGDRSTIEKNAVVFLITVESDDRHSINNKCGDSVLDNLIGGRKFLSDLIPESFQYFALRYLKSLEVGID